MLYYKYNEVIILIKNEAMFKLSYGLFILSTQSDGKDNACIINTATQITDNPKTISIAVNKSNYTCELLQKSKKFTVSVISQEADFELFKRFGFCSGRDTDKFSGYNNCYRTENGTYFICEGTNAYISCKVNEIIDCGSHLLFISEVEEAETLSNVPSATYQYYFDNIKPKPAEKKTKGYVCKICGYVYEGDELPSDFVCPICKHGADDFEPIQ